MKIQTNFVKLMILLALQPQGSQSIGITGTTNSSTTGNAATEASETTTTTSTSSTVQGVNLQQGNTCRLATFIPFTDLRQGPPENHANPGGHYGYGSWPDKETLAKAAFSFMATAEIARRHFNDRDTTLVPELAELEGTCDIQLSDDSAYYDSGYSREKAVDQLLDMQSTAIKAGQEPNANICAVIGPVELQANEGVAVLTENMRIPQVAYATLDHRLSRTELFPTFARIVPEGPDFAQTLAFAASRDLWEREFVGIIYDRHYGEMLEDPLEDAEDLVQYSTITEGYVEGDTESLQDAMDEVRAEGYRTVMVVNDRYAILDDLAQAAAGHVDDPVNITDIDQISLLGDGFMWMLAGAVLPPALMETIQLPVDSPLDKLLNGAVLFTNYDPYFYHADTDPFLKVWKSQTADFVKQLNAYAPIDEDGYFPLYMAIPDYFQTEVPTEFASYIYDAVMATGIAACKAQQASSQVVQEDEENLDHYDYILRSDFTGASGKVSFKQDDDGEYLNSRDPSGVEFGVHNIIPQEPNADGMRGYDVVLHSIYSHENECTYEEKCESEYGAWGEPMQEFQYYGGTTEEPKPLRTVVEENFLSYTVRNAGFALTGIALFNSLACATWIFIFRERRAVKASQPEFLYMLCFGACLVSISLIFISFDEQKGWSEEKLSKGCAAFPWLFVLGYLTMYCALFSKLWRLTKLLSMRRQVVGVQNVLLPFLAVIGSTLIVLTVWQIIAPLQWVRTEISNDDEPVVTYGECQVEENYSSLYFVIPLVILIAGVIITTGYFAWKLKEIQTDLAESRWILFGIFTHLQTWAVGIPIVIITSDVSRDASYIMYVALAFVFSTTLVSFVIWPKIFVWFRDAYMGGPPKKTTRLTVTAPTAPRISGLQHPSAQQFDTTASIRSAAEAQRIKSLEKEVVTLKRRLSEQSSKPMTSGSSDPEQPQQQPLVDYPSNDQLQADA